MIEIFEEAIKAPNLPATALLALVLLYWIVNLLGLFDLEMFGDADVHTDADAHSESGIAKYVGFGDLPITIVISFFALFFWTGTMFCNHYLGNSSLLLGLLIFIPNIFGGFILTKIVTAPLSKVYAMLNKPEEELTSDFTGSVCTLTIEASAQQMGQGEVNRNGDSILVHVKTSEGKILKKGQSALLIEFFPAKGYYLAEPYDSNN
ncbi:MAG: hypothetical protein ACK40G_14565 [Cytophagaceae bacterium]